MKRKRFIRGLAVLVGVCGVVFVFSFPLLWLLDTSFKPISEVFKIPPQWIYPHPTLQNYVDLLLGRVVTSITSPWWQFIANSALVAIGASLLTVACTALAGYGFARLRIPGGQLWLFILLIAQMFPGPSILVPVFAVVKALGLYNSLLGLVLLYTAFAIPFTTWLSVGAFRSVPVEIEQSAMIDGCSRFQVFLHIVLPLVRTSLLTTGIFAFFVSWAEYPFALVLLNSQDKLTVPIGLGKFITEFNTFWNQMGAATVLVSLPIMVLIFFVQRRFVRGLIEGALTG